MYNNSAFDRASAVPRGATYLLSLTYCGFMPYRLPL